MEDNGEHGLSEGGFYWIKIKQYDDGSQHAIRVADKWSVAQWDGDSFEEMNEMYRIEDVVEVGPVVPFPDQLKQRDSEISKLKTALRELIPIIDLMADRENESGHHIRSKRYKSHVDKARKLIELNQPEK